MDFRSRRSNRQKETTIILVGYNQKQEKSKEEIMELGL